MPRNICTAAVPGAAALLLAFWLPAAEARLPEFTRLVKDVAPTVVNVRARRTADSRTFEPRDIPGPFRRFFDDVPRIQQPSSGSGFILSEDGYILTNFHVVDEADEIIVSLQDRSEHEATLVGADFLSDLALLKIDASGLPSAETGDSDSLEVGEWVLAIGAPFGFEYTVTAGVVSGKGRSLSGRNGNYVPFIQTDVAINPGNSGGPLFDMKGRVVGINSQIYTRSGGFMGISFAIPVKVAMDVVQQIRDKGRVSRGWLGVLIQQVNRDLAESFGLSRPAGALISQVLEGGPADKAGLREGDVILTFDGTDIDLSSELPHVVGRTPADKKVELVIVRGGSKRTLSLRVGQLDEAQLLGDAFSGDSADEPRGRLAVEVRGLRQSEIDEVGGGGVYVLATYPGPAREAGILAGDIFVGINREAVGNISRFRDLVKALPSGRAVPTQIFRQGRKLYIPIRLDD